MWAANVQAVGQGPVRKVPAAKIQFLPEDRAWIADRIQEVLSTGQLTLGKYGTEFEQKFAQFFEPGLGSDRFVQCADIPDVRVS